MNETDCDIAKVGFFAATVVFTMVFSSLTSALPL